MPATVFCSRLQRPGALVAEVDGGQVTVVCTSLRRLARFAGEGGAVPPYGIVGGKSVYEAGQLVTFSHNPNYRPSR
ncbi:hypothetical protein [Streptomyces sp. NPDC006335]|uniref:hypothetical protein n=1 Tax=Streptomyces sp. NPDC006335 TaxID=3156895 RepID=UPI0033B47FFD